MSKVIKTVSNNRYQFYERPHKGANSCIYLGRDTLLGREVALKEVSRGSPGTVPSEAKILSKIGHHTNIIDFYDLLYDDRGIPCILLEWLKRRDNWISLSKILEEVRNNEKVIDVGLIYETALQMSQALLHIHSHGVIHQDIKPQNLILGVQSDPLDSSRTIYKIKMIDFGIAVEKGRGSGQGYTPGYASPEQMRNTAIDFTADIFSLGVVLYELSTLRLPYLQIESFNQRGKPTLILPDPVHKLRPEVPPEFGNIIQKCINPDPSERFAPTSRMVEALNALKQPRQNNRTVGYLLNQVGLSWFNQKGKANE